MKVLRYRLEIITFISGASVMILEIVGSRVVAPYIGTSLVVWTSLIGIMLASLSFGYWWGGRIADREATPKTLSLIIFACAFSIAIINVTKAPLLEFLQSHIENIRINAIMGTSALFSLPSILLGMITPYAVKLKLTSLNASGRTVGNLYAISTIGSIAGTFLAGFFLLAYLGNTNILFLLALVLALTSFALHTKSFKKTKIAAIVCLLLAFRLTSLVQAEQRAKDFIDSDTPYQRIWVMSSIDPLTKRPWRILSTDGHIQSAMFLDAADDLALPYTRYYRLGKHVIPDMKKALMLGGGGYSYPKDYLKRHPEATMDVVELDLYVTSLARSYFNLKDDPRLHIFHEDGRTFLNRNSGPYDAIFIDAFKPFGAIPYQLTTKEAVKRMYELLSPEGAVLLNIISAIQGDKGKFLRAEYSTYTSIFPYVYVFPVSSPLDPLRVQNLFLVALKSKKPPLFTSGDPELNEYLSHLWLKPIPNDMPLLTDDFAPVDYYLMNIP